MKSYFTKYLSVETETEEIHYCIPCSNLGGGIKHCAHPEECGNVITSKRAILKSGDVFIDKDLGICIKGKEEPWVEWKGGKTNLRITGEHKKAKLFLCSRDIQIGDKFFKEIGGKEFTFIQGSIDVTWFKIIGEISPNAIWVKEGDEFSESQIDMVPSLHGEEYGADSQSLRLDLDWAWTAKIECPTCGHFH